MADFQGAYSPAADSQLAYQDMGMGTVAAPSTGLTDKQRMLAAQMLGGIGKSAISSPTGFAMAQTQRQPSYAAAPGYVNTMGGR